MDLKIVLKLDILNISRLFMKNGTLGNQCTESAKFSNPKKAMKLEFEIFPFIRANIEFIIIRCIKAVAVVDTCR